MKISKRISSLWIGILACIFCFCSLFAETAPSQNIVLKSDSILFALDGKCRIVSLKDLKSGRDFGGLHGIWRILYKTPDGIDEQWADLSKSSCERISDNSVRMNFTGKFGLEIIATLEGNTVVFTSTISNESDAEIYEFQFPMLKSANIAHPTKFYIGNRQVSPDVVALMDSAQDEKVRPLHKAKNFYGALESSKSFAIADSAAYLIFESAAADNTEISAFVRCHKKKILDFAFTQRVRILPLKSFKTTQFKIYFSETTAATIRQK